MFLIIKVQYLMYIVLKIPYRMISQSLSLKLGFVLVINENDRGKGGDNKIITFDLWMFLYTKIFMSKSTERVNFEWKDKRGMNKKKLVHRKKALCVQYYYYVMIWVKFIIFSKRINNDFQAIYIHTLCFKFI